MTLLFVFGVCACVLGASLTERDRGREGEIGQVVLHAVMRRQNLPMGLGAQNQAAGRGLLAVKNIQNARRSNYAICAMLLHKQKRRLAENHVDWEEQKGERL